MICLNGKIETQKNGSILFICNKGEYNGKQCPYTMVCPKILSFVMIDKFICDYFLPKI